MKTRKELLDTAAALNKQALVMLRQAVMLELQAKMMEETNTEDAAPAPAAAARVRKKPGRKPGAAKAAKAAAQPAGGLTQTVGLLTTGNGGAIKPAADEGAGHA